MISMAECHVTHTHTHTGRGKQRQRDREGGGNVVWLVSCQQKLWRTKSFIHSFHSFTRSVDVRLLLGAYRARHLLSAVSRPPRVGNSIVMRALNRLKHVYTTTCKTKCRPGCGETTCYRPFSHFRWVVGVRSLPRKRARIYFWMTENSLQFRCSLRTNFYVWR